jgi:parallel beta-helix repeat protein
MLLATLLVLNTNDSGPGSLRDALFQTTTSPGSDEIRFELDTNDTHYDPATTTWTITITRSLVLDTESRGVNAVFVDGASQPPYDILRRPVVQVVADPINFSGDSAFKVLTSNSRIRGLSINGIPGDGIQIIGDGNVLEGNFVGVDATGTQAIPNSGAGVKTFSSNNTIGGGVSAANVFSGNGQSGIVFDGTAGSGNNLLIGNLIGTNSAGDAALGNSEHGVLILASSSAMSTRNFISRNVISGNLGDGVSIRSSGDNLIVQNRIGSDASGTQPLPNGGNGVLLTGSTGLLTQNVVGSNEPILQNIIAFNNLAGISIAGVAGNAILINSIFGNVQTGIVLVNSGNHNQAAPSIQSALVDTVAGATSIAFSLQSVPDENFTIRFYSTPAGTANAQGRTFLGSTTVTTNPSGFTEGTFTFSSVLPLGTLITATALRQANGDSSPFSAAIPLIDIADPFVVINTNDAGPGSLRQVILNANTAPGFNTVRFAIPGPGVHTIVLASALPAITETSAVDATTQPGYQGNPLVVVDGSNSGGDGLLILSGATTVKGLVLSGFPDAAIHYLGAGFGRVEGVYIGTDFSGKESRPNGIGILVDDSPAVVIVNNVISGNRTAGVYLQGSKTSNVEISQNKIGTDPDGNHAVVRNGGANPLADLQNTGVVIVDAGNNTVGGTTAISCNIISGNYVGVMIAGAGGNNVWGNYIGTTTSGVSPLGNIVGVYINGSSNNEIGGSTTGQGNTISANVQTGLVIFGASTGNRISGNIVGLGSDGHTVLRGKSGQLAQITGVFILDASNNLIGGASVQSGNTISGNRQTGVFIETRNAAARGNLIQSNAVGPNQGQVTGPGNGLYGVVLYNAPNNSVVQTGSNANRFYGNAGGNVRDFRGPNGIPMLRLARRSALARKRRASVQK